MRGDNEGSDSVPASRRHRQSSSSEGTSSSTTAPPTACPSSMSSWSSQRRQRSAHTVQGEAACSATRATRKSRSEVAPRCHRSTRKPALRRHHQYEKDEDDYSNMVGTDYVVPEVTVARTSQQSPKAALYDQDEEVGIVLHDASSSPCRKDGKSRRHESQRQSSALSSEQNHAANEKKKAMGPCSSEDKSNRTTTSNAKVQIVLEDDVEPLVPIKHFTWMPFGHLRTWSGILLMAMGIVLATLAKRSTAFVTLAEPMVISPQMEPVSNVGLVRLNMCYSQDYLDTLESDSTQGYMPYMNSHVDTTEETTRRGISLTPCFTIRLGADVVDDTMWEVSRVAASLAIALGAFFCLLMISTIRWESINMKPMAVGLLLTYLLQSFSFFFYDSHLCRENSCRLAMGTYLSILASFCWFGASMICILMDVHHTRKMRRLARLERRRRRRLRRELRRKASALTTRTETSFSSDGGTASENSSFDSPSRLSSTEIDVQEEQVVDSEGDVFWKV